MWTLLAIVACRPEPSAPHGPSLPQHPVPGPDGPEEETPAPPISDVAIAVEGVGYAVTLGDVTGDGQLDLIQSDDSALHVFAGPVVGPRTEPDAVITINDSQVAAWVVPTVVGDVDGDGTEDVACGFLNNVDWGDGYGDTGGTRIALGPLDDDTEPALIPLLSPDHRRSVYPEHARVGDLDGDGGVDVAVAWPYDWFGGRVFLVDGTPPGGAPGLPSAWASATGAPDQSFAVDLEPAGDLDGDGTIDLLVSDPPNRLSVVYTGGWTGHRAADTLGPTVTRSADEATELILAGGGDGNGDGRLDLVVGGRQTGGQICVVLDVPESGTHPVEDLGPCADLPSNRAGWQAAWIPDLDGDGRDEVAFTVGSYELGTLYVMPGDRLAEPLDEAPVQLGVRADGLAVGDLTGDGLPDLVVQGEDGIAWVLAGDRLAVLLAR